MDMTTAEKIRVLMKRRNMTMGDMSEKTGQTRQNLSNKMGRNNFSESEIKAMAAAMECTVEIRFLDANGNVEL